MFLFETSKVTVRLIKELGSHDIDHGIELDIPLIGVVV